MVVPVCAARRVGAGLDLPACLVWPRWRRSIALVLLAILAGSQQVRAQTLPGALVHAFQNNPQLNSERARQRATDESVPQALAGYRPQVTATLSAGLLAVRNLIPDNTVQSATLRSWAVGVTVGQTIFNGFKTANTVRQAESQVRAGREALRNIEQNVFLDVVAAYTNVYAAQSLVGAQRVSVDFLRQTLTATRKRLDAGDVTPTDVAQAEARLARGQADLNAAEVALAVAQATYRQVVGTAPGPLVPARPLDRLIPGTRNQAVAIGRREHPTLVGATFDVDTAQAAIKIAESALFPTLTIQGTLSRGVNNDTSLGTTRSDVASVIGQSNIPIYDGGLAASQIRQAKENLAKVRIDLDRARVQIDTAVVAAWVTNDGARIGVTASEAEVRAATLALQGVQREAQAGQRTTLDVLNSLQDLTAAKSRLIQAQRERVLASYTLLAAVGRLDHKHLGLATPDYDPTVHYHQVRDVWHGLRTPSGQ
jgi:outer membrane protein